MTGGTEERSARCGKPCLRRKDTTTVQAKKTQERSHWCLIWRKLSGVPVFQSCVLGRRISISPGRFFVCCAGTSSTRGAFSVKGASRSRSKPPRPFLRGSKWSCSLLLVVFQDALIDVMKAYPPLKLKLFVGDITAMWKGKTSKDLARKARQSLFV